MNSIKSQRLQNQVNEIELKLKDLELKEKETQLKRESCVEARINHVSKCSYRIRVWNSGSAIAKNVSASWDNTFGVILIDDDKMPFEFFGASKVI